MTIRTEGSCLVAPRRRFAAALCLLAWVSCALALLPACGSDSDASDDDDPTMMGTETDNPNVDPPSYESPADFAPPQNPPACPPPDPGATAKPDDRPLWAMSGEILVGAYRYRGLMLVDGSDPSDPQLLAEVPLHGEALQLLVESEGQVAVVLNELPIGAHDDVLSPEQLQPKTKLVRFDVSDPGDVQRVAEVELEGDFWSAQQRGSTLWVVSTAVDQLLTSCDRPRFSCGYQAISALIVAGYRLQDGVWEQTARAELPMSESAWLLDDGFAALDRTGADDPETGVGTLSFARFDGDAALGSVQTLEVAGEPASYSPLNLTDELAQLFVIDYMNGNAELVSVSLATGEVVSRIDDIPQQQFDSSFFSGSFAFIASEATGTPTRMIDFSDPTAPVEQALPAGVRSLYLLDDGHVLGLSDASAQHAYLFAVQDGALVQLADATIAQDPGARGWEGVQQLGNRMVIGYRSGADTHDTAVLEIGESTLTSLGKVVSGYADAFILDANTFYAVDTRGLLVGLLGQEGVQRLQWTHDVIDVVRAGQYQAALVRDDDFAPALELSIDGEVKTTLPVGPMAERLETDGERVLVLSLQPVDQCQQTGLDCDGYTPNVAVVALGDAPEITGTVPLTGMTVGQIDNGWDSLELYADDTAALPLGEGRFALFGRYEAYCQSKAACAELGLEAGPLGSVGTNTASPEPCGPNGECSSDPTPPAPDANGQKRALRIWVLDAAADEPTLTEPVESVLQGEASRFDRPRVSLGQVLVTRLEREVMPGQSVQSQPARFMLDRFVVEDGALVAQPALNIPGYPLVLADDGALLLSAEPDDGEGAGELHLVALDDDAAIIRDSAEISVNYSDALAAFGKVFYLRHSSEDCAGVSALQAFAVPEDADGELVAQPELELPGGRYRFADARDERLLLEDDRGNYAVLDVSGAGAPVLVKFFSAGVSLSHPTLDGDAVIGAANNYGLRTLSF